MHGANPYVDTPSEFPGDPAYDDAGAAWRETTSVYGPAFTLVTEVVARASGSSAAVAAWIFKTLAALGVSRVSHSRRGWREIAVRGGARRLEPAAGRSLCGRRPQRLILIALTLGALVLAGTGRRGAAGVAWALAVLVKWIPAVFFALRAIEARTSRRRVGHAGFAAAALVVVGLATWRYGLDWLRAFRLLARNAESQTSYALPHRLEQSASLMR